MLIELVFRDANERVEVFHQPLDDGFRWVAGSRELQVVADSPETALNGRVNCALPEPQAPGDLGHVSDLAKDLELLSSEARQFGSTGEAKQSSASSAAPPQGLLVEEVELWKNGATPSTGSWEIVGGRLDVPFPCPAVAAKVPVPARMAYRPRAIDERRAVVQAEKK